MNCVNMAIVETMTYEYFKLDRILFEYIWLLLLLFNMDVITLATFHQYQ